MVFVNPFSGTKNAKKIWDRVRRILDIAGYKISELETLYRLHCLDHIKDLSTDELLSFSGIIAVSGDGTPHEILNALFTRPDREIISHIPVGHINGG